MNDSGVFLTRVLQAEFLFAFDLHHLRVMHSDFHSTKAQVSQRALDFPQDGCFVLAVNATQRCAHGAAPEKWGADRVAGVGAIVVRCRYS